MTKKELDQLKKNTIENFIKPKLDHYLDFMNAVKRAKNKDEIYAAISNYVKEIPKKEGEVNGG